MQRLNAYAAMTIAGMFLAIVLVMLPQGAAAHTSSWVDPGAEAPASDPSDGEDHCHGAPDCVVTLFLDAPVICPPAAPKPRSALRRTARRYSEAAPSRDPPIPILSRVRRIQHT